MDGIRISPFSHHNYSEHKAKIGFNVSVGQFNEYETAKEKAKKFCYDDKDNKEKLTELEIEFFHYAMSPADIAYKFAMKYCDNLQKVTIYLYGCDMPAREEQAVTECRARLKQIYDGDEKNKPTKFHNHQRPAELTVEWRSAPGPKVELAAELKKLMEIHAQRKTIKNRERRQEKATKKAQETAGNQGGNGNSVSPNVNHNSFSNPASFAGPQCPRSFVPGVVTNAIAYNYQNPQYAQSYGQPDPMSCASNPALNAYYNASPYNQQHAVTGQYPPIVTGQLVSMNLQMSNFAVNNYQQHEVDPQMPGYIGNYNGFQERVYGPLTGQELLSPSVDSQERELAGVESGSGAASSANNVDNDPSVPFSFTEEFHLACSQNFCCQQEGPSDFINQPQSSVGPQPLNQPQQAPVAHQTPSHQRDFDPGLPTPPTLSAPVVHRTPRDRHTSRDRHTARDRNTARDRQAFLHGHRGQQGQFPPLPPPDSLHPSQPRVKSIDHVSRTMFLEKVSEPPPQPDPFSLLFEEEMRKELCQI